MNRFSDVYNKVEHMRGLTMLANSLDDVIEKLEKILPKHPEFIKPLVMFEKSKEELLKDLSDLQLQQRTIMDFLNSLE